jgi:hypothetical protein
MMAAGPSWSSVQPSRPSMWGVAGYLVERESDMSITASMSILHMTTRLTFSPGAPRMAL